MAHQHPAVTRHQRVEHNVAQGEHMEEGRDPDKAFIAAGGYEGLHHRIALEIQITVGDYRPLGITGGTRCVDEHRHILGNTLRGLEIPGSIGHQVGQLHRAHGPGAVPPHPGCFGHQQTVGFGGFPVQIDIRPHHDARSLRPLNDQRVQHLDVRELILPGDAPLGYPGGVGGDVRRIPLGVVDQTPLGRPGLNLGGHYFPLPDSAFRYASTSS